MIKNKFKCERIYGKKYLKGAKKHKHTKGRFQGLHAPVILIDSIFRKYYFDEGIEI